MNGVHDLGGMDGFGPIERDTDEPVFHAAWEGRVMAMMRALGAAGAFNIDMFRDAREHQPPDFYLTASYYRSWERGLETLAQSRGLVAPDELAAGRSLHPAKPLPREAAKPADVPRVCRRGSYGRPAARLRGSGSATACGRRT